VVCCYVYVSHARIDAIEPGSEFGGDTRSGFGIGCRLEPDPIGTGEVPVGDQDGNVAIDDRLLNNDALTHETSTRARNGGMLTPSVHSG